jgi:hypothetical protein
MDNHAPQPRDSCRSAYEADDESMATLADSGFHIGLH